MPVDSLVTLLRALARAADLEVAARDTAAALRGAIGADLAVVWFTERGATDPIVAVAGTGLSAYRPVTRRTPAPPRGLAVWLGRRGAAVVRAVPIPDGSGLTGELAVGWTSRVDPPSDVDGWLTLVADQLAVLAERLALEQQARNESERRLALEDEIVRTLHLRAIGEVASGVIHDVNNGLTTVVGLTDWLLLTLPADAGGRRELDIVRTAAEDCAAVLRRFHEFGRSGHAPDSGHLADLPSLVSEVVELASPRRQRAQDCGGAPVSIDVETLPVPRVLASASEIRELLLNLVLNAIDALPAGGHVRLRTFTIDGEAAVSVIDDGTGMSEAVRARAFEPFFTTKGAGGSGLGLAVGRLLAERHGGRLDLESTPGGGTVVTLRLPAATAQAPPGDAGVDPDPVACERLRILLVDDEPDVLDSVGGMLASLGHTVVPAANGIEALKALSEQGCDVVVTDLGMPVMNGIELARHIREVAPRQPVILLTGWAGELARQRPDGIDRVQAKPVTMRQLAEALAAVTSPTVA